MYTIDESASFVACKQFGVVINAENINPYPANVENMASF